MTTTTPRSRPNLINRIRSRQSGHPSGLLGRAFGRLMVKDTSAANDQAIELLGLDAPCSILEIGFGQGRTASKLLDEGHHLLGVEASTTMVSQGRARNRRACREGRADLRLGDGVNVPFDDNSVDAAFTVHTIYFMPDPPATIAEIARVLRPGGRLVIACRVSDDDTPPWMDHDIYQIRSASKIVDLLAGAGFGSVVHHLADETMHHTHMFVADLAS